MMFLNVQGLRAHVKSVRPVLTGWLSRSHGQSEKPAGQRLDRILDLMGIIDGLFAAAHVEESRFRLVVGAVVAPNAVRPASNNAKLK